jgi:predicted tellurium resistance membrane protein TerC
MLELLLDPGAWISLLTLTVLEIVLGIDNVIFISLLVARLPAAQRERARRLGLGLAMLTRIALLLSIAWVMRLSEPWFHLFAHAVSGRDLVLLGGGLFLIAKASLEIHESLEGEPAAADGSAAAGKAMLGVVLQIAVIDIVFSLDSVITAVGLAEHVPVMVLAIVIAVGVMLWAARPVGDFVERHPTVKMLALSFLVLVGTALVAEGAGFHIPRGYLYFAIAFSLAVETLNLRLRRVRAEPVRLRGPGA